MICADCGRNVREVCSVRRYNGREYEVVDLCEACFDVAEALFVKTRQRTASETVKPRPFRAQFRDTRMTEP